MNFQQLSNLQYWTSLFASPWTIAINLIDILIVAYILYHFYKSYCRNQDYDFWYVEFWCLF